MSSTTPKGLAARTLLLFAPQTHRLNPSRLSELWSTIQSDPRLAFLIEIVKTLPSLWESTVLSGCPQLERLTLASEQLQQLVQFFETGDAEILPTKTPYEFLLVPLTVISQIAEYISLGREGTVQGFCVGFLAATAVATSSNTSELERWAATAVRLALCIGAIVDMDERERSHNRSLTWSVRWTSSAEEKHFQRILASFPEVNSYFDHTLFLPLMCSVGVCFVRNRHR
jgi:hypothetical protein